MDLRLWHPRTIASRIVIGLAGLVVVVVGGLGAVTTSVTSDAQVRDLDRDVLAALARVPGAPRSERGTPGPGTPGVVLPDRQGLAGLGPRPIAQMVLATDGSIVLAAEAGPADDRHPLPDVEALPDSVVGAPGTPGPPTVVTLPATDGGLTYRVAARLLPGGELYVVGAPLDDVEAVAADLRRVFVLGGGMGVLVLVVGGWFIVRAGLAPLRRLSRTSDRVAQGDLAARASGIDDATEVGHLAATFNRMLDELEEAVATRDRSQDRLKQFVADAGHELRSPLTTLRGYAQLYEAGRLTDPELLDQALQSIGRNGARMQRLVEDLLTLARLDLEQPLDRERLDLGSLVREAAQDVLAVAPQRSVHVEVEDQLHVHGDRHKLRQVLDNLLANARSHTPAEASVMIRAGRHPDGVALSVADDGPGIPPEQVDRLFDRFFRGDPARAHDRNGSGLGLAIVQAVVQAHGGRIEVDSQLGRGTTFTAVFPAASTRTRVTEPQTA